MNLQDVMPFGLDPIDVITIMAAVTAFLVVFAVYSAALSRDPMRGRVKALQDRRDALKAGLMTPQRRRKPIKKVDSVDAMRQVVSKLQLLQSEQTRKVSQMLVQAGWRSKDAVVVYMFFKMVLPILIAIVMVILLFGMNMFADKPMMRMMVGLGSILFAFLGPDIYVKNAISKRVAEIRKALPDALDLLVICAEAGLTLDAALNRVSREMAHTCAELADEFSLTAIELGFLPDRRHALQNLTDRVQLDAMRGVVTTLIQTEKYGTPLAMSLRVLSAEFRNERMMKAEEKAARLPATMTVPLILFILPTLFIVLLGPAACKVADEFVNR